MAEWIPDPSGTGNSRYLDYNSGSQTIDFNTTDENSTHAGVYANQYQLFDSDGNEVTEGYHPTGSSWITFHPNLSGGNWVDGQMTVDFDASATKTDVTWTGTIKFFDGTEWITNPVTLHIQDTPPGGTNYDTNFYSPTVFHFLEDAGEQVLDIQYAGEGNGIVTYALAAGYTLPSWLTLDPDFVHNGIIKGTPDNRNVTHWENGTPSDEPIDIDITVHDSSGDHDYTEQLVVDNVTPYWTEPDLGTLFFVEDHALDANGKYVVATDGQVQNSDEGHYDASYLPGSDSGAHEQSWYELQYRFRRESTGHRQSRSAHRGSLHRHVAHQ